MCAFGRLFRRHHYKSGKRDDSSATGNSVDGTTADIHVHVNKCPVPMVWLDTSVFLNLAKLELGILNDGIQESRLHRLHQRIYDLTRQGKLMCLKASQKDEVWVKRSDFLAAIDELSLGVTTQPKAAIENTQLVRLMRAYIDGTRIVAFSYEDAFIDGPLPRFAQTLARGFSVTVDSGLIGTIEAIQSQRDTIHEQWEELRKRCTMQGVTFEQQLRREHTGDADATISMAQNCLKKAADGQEPTEDEKWLLRRLRNLGCAWDRLGGKPEGIAGLVRFLGSPYYRIGPFNDVSSNLTAKLMVGARAIKHGDAMDVDHISSMLPYVNLMIVDRYMRSLVRDLGLDRKYGTTVCYIGDDAEIKTFFETTEKSTVGVTLVPPFFDNQGSD